MQANLTDTDSAILKAVSAWVQMEPGDFLKLAGLSLADALTGLYAAMSKSPDIREQVRQLVLMRQANHLNDIEFDERVERAGRNAEG